MARKGNVTSDLLAAPATEVHSEKKRSGGNPLTREQELWGIALWLDRTHGDRGAEHIALQVARLAGAGEEQGVALWRSVAERYDKLRERTVPH